MTSSGRITILMCILCAILSVLLIFLLTSITKNNKFYDTQAERIERLQESISGKQTEIDELRRETQKYKDELDAFSQEVINSGGYAASLEKEVEEARIIAGITDLSGPGVIVTMNDSTEQNILGESEQKFIIHDSEILLVINELCDAGAEALSLNGERIISTSEIRCTGATVSINNKRYAPPFIIRAIGNPETLESALFMRGGIIDILNQWKIEVKVEKSGSVFIGGYSGKLEFEYAKPFGFAGIPDADDVFNLW